METTQIIYNPAKVQNVLSLPTRNGNGVAIGVGAIKICVLSLPTRNGNGGTTPTKLPPEIRVLSLPTRNGNVSLL